MMRQLLILADDLSGAADCANACMRSGLSAVVTFDDAGRHVTSEVLSIDCDTRHLESDDAAARVVNVMRRHIGVEPDLLLFKKVDSTLRGNVAVELSAVLKERRRLTNGKERIVSVMAPAFPSGGRTTIEGNQMVHGVALHKTEMWIHDGLVGPAHIPSMLAKAGLRPASLGLNLVRGDGKQLKLAMQQMAGEADVLVCDVEKDEDLSAIAEASMVLGRQTVWAGSAGLAHQVPHAAGLSGRSRSFQQPRFADGPLLFVIGSMSSVSRRQAEVLEREVPIAGIHVSPSLLLAGPHAPKWSDVAAQIASSLHAGEDTLVLLDANEHVDQNKRRKLTDALGMMLVPHANTVGALVATGGETARAILDEWKIASLRIVNEVEHGLPFSIIEAGGRPLPVLTKAGAFGGEETLLSCWNFLNDLLRGNGQETSEIRRTS